MSELPEWARLTCEKCGHPVAYVRTPRKSKGQPVELLIDFMPETGTAGTVLVQVTQDVLYGNPIPKAHAAAVRAVGRELHAPHQETCIKHSGTRKRA